MKAALRLFAVGGLFLPLAAAAAGDADLDALQLADTAAVEPVPASDWRSFAEVSLGVARLRRDSRDEGRQRLSVDVQFDHALSADWRVFVADRLDLRWPARAGEERAINTLKEAYVSWQAGPESLFDLGRVNVKSGVATGYNPTDYFRAGALRSVVSINPASLRENRQGSVMLRAQHLWDDASVSVMLSPRLEQHLQGEGFNPDLGATNGRHRGLLTWSQRVGGFTPQVLVYQEEAASTQLGFNLTGLINDSTVAHGEWSGGRSPSQLAQSLAPLGVASGGDGWHNRLAAGMTYTSTSKLSLTAEFHYNGSALDSAGWQALRQGPLPLYGQYRNWSATAQDLPTRRSLFLYGSWPDALVNHLDLSALYRHDLVDSSRLAWLEARYHQGRYEYAVQWQGSGGEKLSTYGALPDSRSWQALLRIYY